MQLHTLTLKELSDKLILGEVSSEKLTEHFLNRIETLDHQLNALVSYQKEPALKEAQRIDKEKEVNPEQKLSGIPILHKDIFCTKGVKTTCASKMLDNFIPPYSATVVERLASKNMITLGKTNMDEFAMGSSGQYSFYGATKNPWNQAHIPGGSSSGSAAAVAAGLAPIATGSDTGGSIRQPAAFCGITGFKPTYGRISRHGMVAFASSFDTVGFLAKSSEDIAFALSATSGACPQDSTCSKRSKENYESQLGASLSGLRLGFPKAMFGEQLQEGMKDLLMEAIEVYESMGAKIVPIEIPNMELGLPVYYVLASAEASANLARYDGVRYGYRSDEAKNLESLYELSRTEGFGEEVKRRIMTGTFVLSSESYETYYLSALKARRLILQTYTKIFDSVDLIIMPTTPHVASAFNKEEDPTQQYWEDYFTVQANLAGLPAISHPCGFLKGLPVGIQLMGPSFGDARVLAAASQYQGRTEFHRFMPKLPFGSDL